MKKLTKRQIALRKKCIVESDNYFKRGWSKPGFVKGVETFRQEYAMNIAMYKAKKESGLTQSAIAERMGIPRPKTTICLYLEPIIGVGFAALFLGERPTLMNVPGGVVIVVGVVVANWRSRLRKWAANGEMYCHQHSVRTSVKRAFATCQAIATNDVRCMAMPVDGKHYCAQHLK